MELGFEVRGMSPIGVRGHTSLWGLALRSEECPPAIVSPVFSEYIGTTENEVKF
jgi:hypothetical protein